MGLAAINGVLLLGDLTGVPGTSETGISEFTRTEDEITVTGEAKTNNYVKFRDVVRRTPENISDMTVDTTAWRNYSEIQIANKLATYNCYIGRVRFHHEESTLGDKYDEHGFVNALSVISHDVTDDTVFQTFYQSITSAPAPPQLGDAKIPTSYYFS